MKNSNINPQPTVVVNCKYEEYDVYIGRPSKWGNPFSKGSRSEKLEQFRKWILTQPNLLNSLHELDGKRLGCWCKPKACHGDIYIELLDKIKSGVLLF
jgi:hypothetical protein